MKRLRYHRYGSPDVLALGDADTPTPGRGQVLVRVRVAAANAMDWSKSDDGTTAHPTHAPWTSSARD
jgi:NADPH:quinone reductase-like Zn-dependent oxidoreductase